MSWRFRGARTFTFYASFRDVERECGKFGPVKKIDVYDVSRFSAAISPLPLAPTTTLSPDACSLSFDAPPALRQNNPEGVVMVKYEDDEPLGPAIATLNGR